MRSSRSGGSLFDSGGRRQPETSATLPRPPPPAEGDDGASDVSDLSSIEELLHERSSAAQLRQPPTSARAQPQPLGGAAFGGGDRFAPDGGIEVESPSDSESDDAIPLNLSALVRPPAHSTTDPLLALALAAGPPGRAAGAAGAAGADGSSDEEGLSEASDSFNDIIADLNAVRRQSAPPDPLVERPPSTQRAAGGVEAAADGGRRLSADEGGGSSGAAAGRAPATATAAVDLSALLAQPALPGGQQAAARALASSVSAGRLATRLPPALAEVAEEEDSEAEGEAAAAEAAAEASAEEDEGEEAGGSAGVAGADETTLPSQQQTQTQTQTETQTQAQQQRQPPPSPRVAPDVAPASLGLGGGLLAGMQADLRHAAAERAAELERERTDADARARAVEAAVRERVRREDAEAAERARVRGAVVASGGAGSAGGGDGGGGASLRTRLARFEQVADADEGTAADSSRARRQGEHALRNDRGASGAARAAAGGGGGVGGHRSLGEALDARAARRDGDVAAAAPAGWASARAPPSTQPTQPPALPPTAAELAAERAAALAEHAAREEQLAAREAQLEAYSRQLAAYSDEVKWDGWRKDAMRRVCVELATTQPPAEWAEGMRRAHAANELLQAEISTLRAAGGALPSAVGAECDAADAADADAADADADAAPRLERAAAALVTQRWEAAVRVAALEATARSLRAEAAARESHVASMERQVSAAATLESAHRNRLAELAAEVATLATANARLGAEASAQRIDAVRLGQLGDERDGARAQSALLERRIGQLRAEADALRDGSAARAELQALGAELAAARARVAELDAAAAAAAAASADALALAAACARARCEVGLVTEALLADEIGRAEGASAALALRGGGALGALRATRAARRAAELGYALRCWAVAVADASAAEGLVQLGGRVAELAADAALATAQAAVLVEVESGALSAADERALYGATREQLENDLHALSADAAEGAAQLALARARLQRREDDLVLLLRRHDALEAKAGGLATRLADALAGGRGYGLGGGWLIAAHAVDAPPTAGALVLRPSLGGAEGAEAARELARVAQALVAVAADRDRWRVTAEAAEGANASLAAEVRAARARGALLERERELSRATGGGGGGGGREPAGALAALGLGERLRAVSHALETLVGHVHRLAECGEPASSKARDARRSLFAAAAHAFEGLHADALVLGGGQPSPHADPYGATAALRAGVPVARVALAADVRAQLQRAPAEPSGPAPSADAYGAYGAALAGAAGSGARGGENVAPRFSSYY